MRLCRRDLSPYQRRSVRTIEIMMGISIALSIILQAIIERHNLSLATRYGMAVLSITPIMMTIILIARYLNGEKDEYMRNLVVQSMLWGLGMVMIADAFFSYIDIHTLILPLGNTSMNAFIVTTSIALEIKLWRNQ
jgi:hypothetical protein